MPRSHRLKALAEEPTLTVDEAAAVAGDEPRGHLQRHPRRKHSEYQDWTADPSAVCAATKIARYRRTPQHLTKRNGGDALTSVPAEISAAHTETHRRCKSCLTQKAYQALGTVTASCGLFSRLPTKKAVIAAAISPFSLRKLIPTGSIPLPDTATASGPRRS